MGHFGRAAITWGWLGLVLPALVLNYFGRGRCCWAIRCGQRAVLHAGAGLGPDSDGGAVTAATVIASQAVITGAYSVASQAAQIGYLPRLRIAHTSESSIGQIQVPWINAILWWRC